MHQRIRIVVAAGLIQLAIGLIVRRPWWIPDLLLASLVVASVTSRLSAGMTLALWAGILAMAHPCREPLVVGCGYAAAGWLVLAASARWDLSEWRAQAVTVAMLEAGLLALWMAADRVVTLRLLAWSAWKLELTVACVPWVRRAMGVSSWLTASS